MVLSRGARGAAGGPLPAVAGTRTRRRPAWWRALAGLVVGLLPLGSLCHDTDQSNSTQAIAAGACGGGGGVVPVGPSAVRTSAALFSGARNGSCCRDLVCVGSPNVSLGQVQWGGDGCAGGELTVFAPGRGVQRREYPDALLDSVQLPESPEVVAKLWVVAKSGEVDAIRARGVEDFAVAAERLDALASGVRLRLGKDARVPTDGAGAALAAAIGNRCDVITASIRKEQPDEARSRYYAGSDTLNVYYVATVAPDCPSSDSNCYDDGGSDAAGWLHGISCASDDSLNRGHPEILFVSGELSSRAETLLHEIGHSLGLIRPQWGHTNDLEDFPERNGNLMYDGVNTVENITVGQLWRLHYEPTSWQFPRSAESLFKACQDNPRDDAPCPPLALRTSQQWP